MTMNTDTPEGNRNWAAKMRAEGDEARARHFDAEATRIERYRAPATRFAAYETWEVREELDAQRILMKHSTTKSHAGRERLRELEEEMQWRDAVSDDLVEERQERAALYGDALPY